jgi:hypothetical protein
MTTIERWEKLEELYKYYESINNLDMMIRVNILQSRILEELY